MNWYSAFFSAVLLLWAFSSPRDKMALRVVLIATVGSFLLTEGFTRGIHAPWKLVFPGLVETLTILALLRFSPNRTGYLQAGLLVIAWGAHALCYFDLMTGSNLVYDEYERILGFVASGQLVACYDTVVFNYHRAAAFLADRPRGVPAGSGAACVLHQEGGNRL